MKIGITGSIACGKSTVIKYLEASGYPVYDADKISYSLTLKNNVCYNMIVDKFGNKILKDDDEIDRKKLGEIIFGDDEKRKLLESIIHPHVIETIKKINDDICFIEVPLLYEVGLERLFDKVLVVSCDRDVQIARLMKRNGYNEQDALKRIDSQMDLKIKVLKADYVINNNGNIEYVHQSIDNFLKGIK